MSTEHTAPDSAGPAPASAADRREPPAAAGTDSNDIDQMRQSAQDCGVLPPATLPGHQPTHTDSTADKGTDKAQATRSEHQPVTSTEPHKEQGHIPAPSPLADDRGKAVVTELPRMVRGPDGRIYNPAKGPPPESPRKDGTKPQPTALLKPDAARTYGDSGSGSGSGTGDSQAVNLGITGLSDIPKAWGELPGSVSLSAAIEWVQQNRLYVVKETPGRGVKVDLSKAKTPAPSLTAISWLETSIRSYAKFIEVASKTATAGNDEAEFVRKERMRIGEIRALLEEMKDAGKAS